MITRPVIFRRKFLSATRHFLAWLENNGRSDVERNGERAFVEAMFRFFHDTRRQRVVLFDVGANNGDYSAMIRAECSAAHLESEVHLFEPMVASAESLERRFARDRSMHIVHAAVSDTVGETCLYADAPGSRLASLYRRNFAGQGMAIELHPTNKITAIRLDDYIEERALQHIDFLKMDIEGHELAALTGLGAYLNPDFIDFVQFEYGGANLDSKTSLRDLYGIFEAHGFIVTKVMRGGLERRAYSPWMENFQYANYVAVSSHLYDSLP